MRKGILREDGTPVSQLIEEWSVEDIIGLVLQKGHKKWSQGNSLVVQWLGLCTFTAEGLGSIPGQGTKIPQARQHSQNKIK